MWSVGFFVSEIANRNTEFVKDVDLGILSGEWAGGEQL